MADRVGKLDRVITIQTVTETRDNYGAWSSSWSTYATRFAAIKYVAGSSFLSEPYQSDRKTGHYSIMFTVRRDSLTKAITPKMRISYESKLYDIRQVTERTDEYRRQYITIEGEWKDLT